MTTTTIACGFCGINDHSPRVCTMSNTEKRRILGRAQERMVKAGMAEQRAFVGYEDARRKFDAAEEANVSIFRFEQLEGDMHEMGVRYKMALADAKKYEAAYRRLV